MDLTGKVLGGRYDIVERVGGGGMADVYRAKCKLLNRNVAVKVLRQDLRDDKVFIERFNTESQAAASLSQTNIVSIYDVGEEDGIYYIVMEYVQGETLKEYIERVGKLPWKEALGYAAQVASALVHAHKNSIVHRDIKPHNIIITKDGILKVTDFGIAKVPSRSTMMLGNSTIGSVHYFSPEQARGGYTDARTDIYSLGVVMYEMMSGRVPFDSDSPVSIAIKHIQEPPVLLRHHNLSVPLSVEKIVTKAMSKEQSGRYASAADMLAEIETVLNGEPSLWQEKNVDTEQTLVMPRVDIPVDSAADDNRDNKKKERLAVITAVASSVVLIGVIAFFVMSSMGWLFFSNGKEVEVPDLKGMQIKDAQEKFKASFMIVELQKVTSDDNEGTILSQKPKNGVKVKKKKENIKIEVEVSRGIDGVKLKDYFKRNYNDVEAELENLGFNVQVEKEVNYFLPPNVVIKTLPLAGTVVKLNSDIKIYVSLAPEVVPSPSPHYVQPSPMVVPSVVAVSPVLAPSPSPTSVAVEESPDVLAKPNKSAVFSYDVESDARVKIMADNVKIYEKVHKKDDRVETKIESNLDSVCLDIYYNDKFKCRQNVNLK